MERNQFTNNDNQFLKDYGPSPLVINIEKATEVNDNF